MRPLLKWPALKLTSTVLRMVFQAHCNLIVVYPFTNQDAGGDLELLEAGSCKILQMHCRGEGEQAYGELSLFLSKVLTSVT
jgi:hypothetical protein